MDTVKDWVMDDTEAEADRLFPPRVEQVVPDAIRKLWTANPRCVSCRGVIASAADAAQVQSWRNGELVLCGLSHKNGCQPAQGAA